MTFGNMPGKAFDLFIQSCGFKIYMNLNEILQVALFSLGWILNGICFGFPPLRDDVFRLKS